MKIIDAKCSFFKEKLKSPFGFKGGYLSELWQVVCKIKVGDVFGVGVGVQSVLWSDEKVFCLNSEEDGNLTMYKTTEYATKLLIGKTFTNPIDLSDGIFEQVYAYAKTITEQGDKLRATFVRNAMVAIDNALWQTYAKINNTQDFLSLVDEKFKNCLSEKQEYLSSVPLVSYGVKKEEIKSLIENGAVLLKIKIGFDNGGKMSQEQMLEWDKNRLKEIDDIAKAYKTDRTFSGKILYYLDANGKYSKIELVNKLLDFAKDIGALESIVLLEEPFPEELKIDVSSLPVRVTADESVHCVNDVVDRIDLGYKAITLKPIAKTMSETLKILSLASEKGVHCFCADLTVNPLLVEWNKNIASRIKPLPEMKIGIIESNGEQNYLNWNQLKTYHPAFGKSFTEDSKGIYKINQEFYETSGGIFSQSNYYDNLID